MALRHIVTKEDSILHKVCREQVKFDSRLHQLLDDMAETLENANGVGLAAPQVGILRRVVLVIETNVEDEDDEEILELINPVIVSSEGEQTGAEGCLSVPGEYGIVTRPSIVTVRAQDGTETGLNIKEQALQQGAYVTSLTTLTAICSPKSASVCYPRMR